LHFLFAALLALLLVFMVLAGTFESLVHPLTIVIAVPLALVGVAAILIPLGRPIGVMEMLGMIVLSGIAVNDAILLLDTSQRLIASGIPRRESLARAAGIRLRPILMTTATTVLGLTPMALGLGDGAEIRTPMAIAVISGLISSTALTLIVIPSIYVLADSLKMRLLGVPETRPSTDTVPLSEPGTDAVTP